jgi:hypothetical protein
MFSSLSLETLESYAICEICKGQFNGALAKHAWLPDVATTGEWILDGYTPRFLEHVALDI